MAGVNESGWLASLGNRLRGLGANYDEERDRNAPGMERELQSRGIVPIINEGGIHENPTDRMFAQARAAMNNREGEAELFNRFALGDMVLPANEAEQNRRAGDLGRRLGAARRYEIDRAERMRRAHAPSEGFLAGLFRR